MSQKIKKRLFEILEVAKADDLISRLFEIFIMTLISLNVIAVILETVKSLSSRYMYFFQAFETFSVTVFTIEYLLRLYGCTADNRFRDSIKGRIRYAVTPSALVDLIAILPFFLPMIIPFDMRFIRALRLFRLFRLFKMGRYFKAMEMIKQVFKEKKEELLIAVVAILILLIIASSLIYFIENEAQPEAFSSIPAAMWWGVATLTTVGYGDIYPVTPIGKILGSIIALLGIGIFTLPAGILASGFSEKIHHKRIEEQRICPHCGKSIE